MDIDKIKWTNYLTKGDLPLPSSMDITVAETELDRTLPDDYKAVLMKHQCQISMDLTVAVGDTEEPIGCLYHVNKNTLDPTYNVQKKREAYLEKKIDWLIPFTDNSANSEFCFNYRNNKNLPNIVFVNRDYDINEYDAITYVASSFTDFLQKAYIYDQNK